MIKEIELKFEIEQDQITSLSNFLNQWVDCDKAEFSRIANAQSRVNSLKLSNTYYDTPDHYLRKHKSGLRVRVSESCHQKHIELTLKSDGKSVAGVHERNEFNVDLSSTDPDLSVLPKGALPDNCDINQLQSRLMPLFTTDFNRETWLISFADSEIEVALDCGKILSANKQDAILELELELKQGNLPQLIHFAIELSRFNLHLFSRSKAARGYALLNQTSQTKMQFDQTMEQDLIKLLAYWQHNEEYALYNNDLHFYQNVLEHVSNVLMSENLTFSAELTEWQSAISSISSVKQFAYSQINTTLKLMLFLFCVQDN